MEYFAVDITNPRIQKAMVSLGIEDEDLVLSTLEDFGDKETTEEIRKLRFNYFERKQQELIRQIKTFVKEDILRNREKALKAKCRTKPPVEILITSLADNSEDSFIKTKSNYKKIIDKTYFDVKEALIEKQAIEQKLKTCEKNRKQAKSVPSKNRIKIEELKSLQKENLQKIKAQEKKSLRSYSRNISSASPNRFRSTTKLYEAQKSRSRSSSLQELNIDEQISKYEEKMNKSKKLYELTILTKKNAVAKLLERPEKKSKSPNQDLNLIEKISKIVQKNKSAEERRFGYLKQIAENREKNKEKQEERKQRAQSRLKEQQALEKKKGKDIEKKMKISSSLIQQKQNNWVKELEIRSEMQRLRDEEAACNAERKKRIMRFKRENVLEKQISDSFRIEAIKKSKEERVKKKLEIAMRTMREKEKLHEVLVNIRKTPESRIMGKKQEKVLESLYNI